MSLDTSKSRVSVALICIHISTGIYILLGIMIPVWLTIDDLNNGLSVEAGGVIIGSVIVLGGCSLIAFLVELVASAIRRRSFGGWVVGLILFSIYVPTLFMPLGIVGLWSLLLPASRREFGFSVKQPDESGLAT